MGVPYAEVIGDPIARSKSPTIHKFWLEKLSLAGDYGRTAVTCDSLHLYLASRRSDSDWRGCSVTMPLKQAVIPFVGRLEPGARRTWAVNAVTLDADGARRGHNTDSLAVEQCLRRAGMAAYPNHVATYVQIVGTGGAARAAADGAIRAGYGNLDIEFFGRDVAMARALAGHFSGQPDFGQDLGGLGGTETAANAGKEQRYSNVLINASPLGMRGYPALGVDIGSYRDDTIVVDLVYDPVETPLLRSARDRGLKTIDGLEILTAQAEFAFELFFGAPAPRQHDSELREILTR